MPSDLRDGNAGGFEAAHAGSRRIRQESDVDRRRRHDHVESAVLELAGIRDQ